MQARLICHRNYICSRVVEASKKVLRDKSPFGFQPPIVCFELPSCLAAQVKDIFVKRLSQEDIKIGTKCHCEKHG